MLCLCALPGTSQELLLKTMMNSRFVQSTHPLLPAETCREATPSVTLLIFWAAEEPLMNKRRKILNEKIAAFSFLLITSRSAFQIT